MPKRIQRKRTKGWKKPDNTIYVGRGSEWGNPYETVAEYRDYMMARIERQPVFLQTIKQLKGKNLMCWCALSKECHADVLLEVANA